MYEIKAGCPPIMTEVPLSDVGAFEPLKSEPPQGRVWPEK